MKERYTGKLRCATCGDTESFEFNDDKSYIKCVKCNREYFGGYDELLSYNQETIEEVKGQIEADAELTSESLWKIHLKATIFSRLSKKRNHFFYLTFDFVCK